MKINPRGELGRTPEELADCLRVRPDAELDQALSLDPSEYNQALELMFDDAPALNTWQDCDLDPAWHQERQQNWYMPQEYQNCDIVTLLMDRCDTPAERECMALELWEFQNRDLFPMLRYLHYLVTTLKSHDVVLGVGRGSSVASFALYKLGVHRIDSLKFGLNLSEFLK